MPLSGLYSASTQQPQPSGWSHTGAKMTYERLITTVVTISDTIQQADGILESSTYKDLLSKLEAYRGCVQDIQKYLQESPLRKPLAALEADFQEILPTLKETQKRIGQSVEMQVRCLGAGVALLNSPEFQQLFQTGYIDTIHTDFKALPAHVKAQAPSSYSDQWFQNWADSTKQKLTHLESIASYSPTELYDKKVQEVAQLNTETDQLIEEVQQQLQLLTASTFSALIALGRRSVASVSALPSNLFQFATNKFANNAG